MGYFLWFCLLGAVTTGVCALLFLTLGLEHRYGRATLLSILIGTFISLLTSRPAFFGTGLFPAEAGDWEYVWESVFGWSLGAVAIYAALKWILPQPSDDD